MNRSHLFLSCCVFVAIGVWAIAAQEDKKDTQTPPPPPSSNQKVSKPPALKPVAVAGQQPPVNHGKCVGISTVVAGPIHAQAVRLYRVWEDGTVEVSTADGFGVKSPTKWQRYDDLIKVPPTPSVPKPAR